jgi:hypothetical protein
MIAVSVCVCVRLSGLGLLRKHICERGRWTQVKEQNPF